MFDFTTADRASLSKVWRAIADEMGDDRFFTTKELDHLPSILAPEEQVLAFSSGLHKSNTWLIVLTNERVIFLDKGMIYGLRQSSIELERVNNIDSEKGLMFGKISIGSNAEIYEITNVWKKTVDPFTKKLREAIKAKHAGIIMRAPGIEQPVHDEPLKEARLKDEAHGNLVEHDYDVYSAPEESGPLALHHLSSPAEEDLSSAVLGSTGSESASLIRLKKAGLA